MYKKNIPFRQDQGQFIKIFGEVYESSPWIAEKVFSKGIKPEHNNPEILHGAMKKIVNSATKVQKLSLLCAHPDLAGKLAISGNLTKASVAEQNSADLSNCTLAEFELFEDLNTQYNNKFGFPFILAVRGFQRAQILEIFKKRINNDIKIEFNEALMQVHRIALLRLRKIE